MTMSLYKILNLTMIALSPGPLGYIILLYERSGAFILYSQSQNLGESP